MINDRRELLIDVGLVIFILVTWHHPELEPWLTIGWLTALAANKLVHWRLRKSAASV